MTQWRSMTVAKTHVCYVTGWRAKIDRLERLQRPLPSCIHAYTGGDKRALYNSMCQGWLASPARLHTPLHQKVLNTSFFLLGGGGGGWREGGFLVWNRFPLNMTEGGGTVTVQCMAEGINLGLSLPRLGNGLLGDQRWKSQRIKFFSKDFSNLGL
jgi:hypothetical protein